MDNEMKKLGGFRLTPIALAIAAMGFAASPMVFAANGASAATSQTVTGSFGPSGGGGVAEVADPAAKVDGHAFAGSAGNLGVNAAAGAGNAQDNAATVVDAKLPTQATISASAHQSFGTKGLSVDTNPNASISNRAVIDGHAFTGAVGNLAANVGAGAANEQANDAALVSAPGPSRLAMRSSVSQSSENVAAGNDEVIPPYASGATQAAVGGEAFQRVHGNLGVNDAAGQANQQANALTVASNAGAGSTAQAAVRQAQTGAQLEAGAVVQQSVGPTLRSNATVNGHAFEHDSGNVGANVAAGAGNQQGNAATIADGSVEAAAASVTQAQTFDDTSAGAGSGGASTQANATVGGHAFADDSGNVAANVATGAGNQQGNAATVVDDPDGAVNATVGQAQDENYAIQSAVSSPVFLGSLSAQSNATVGGHAFAGDSGNVATSVASGAGNQQGNATTVAGGSGSAATAAVTQASRQESADSETGELFSGGSSVSQSNATMTGDAFQGDNGNVSANVASGAANQQGNATLIANGASQQSGASVSQAQAGGGEGSGLEDLTGATSLGAAVTSQSNATVAGSAFANDSGNVGANVAAGSGNQQGNATTLASGARGEASAAVKQSAHDGFSVLLNGAASEYPAPELAQTSATVDGNAFRRDSGNVGANAASGVANAQGNALDVADETGSAAVATVTQAQDSEASGTENEAYRPGNAAQVNASVVGHAFQDDSGNVGANVAAGAGNQQANAATVVAGSPSAATATVGQTQSSTESLDEEGTLLFLTSGNAGKAQSNAMVADHAFEGARGNVGANVAAGAGNQQANVATVSAGGSATAGAAIQQAQRSTDTESAAVQPGEVQPGQMRATIAGNAFRGDSGNLGVNVASGAGNQQANALALADTVGSAKAATSNVSQSANAADDTAVDQSTNVGGFVFQGATGNIGVNVASGAGNQQANATTILASNTLSGEVTGHGTQQSVNGTAQSTNATATLGGDAFAGAHGNVGLNEASGAGNLQANTLTVVGP